MQRQIEEGVIIPHLVVVKATLLSIIPSLVPPRYYNEITLDLARRSSEVATCISKNTQNMVYAAERLSGLLKQGYRIAIEEQVEAEVEGSSTRPDTQEISNIWSRVAADFIENSRVADELVRGMTGFLLGIGRVMRISDLLYPLLRR